MNSFIIIAFIILLFFSALFSSSETALVSISKYRAKRLGKFISWLKENEDKALITILIFNNLVNVLISGIASIIASHYGGIILSITTFVVTFIIVTFGEIIPKSLAIKNSSIVITFSSPIIYYLTRIFSPIVAFYSVLSSKFAKGKKERLSEEEIELMVIDAIKEPLAKIIADNLFELSKLKVKHILTPWNKVIKFNDKTTIEEGLRLMKENKITKLISEDGNSYVLISDIILEKGKVKDKSKPTKKIPEETTLITALSILKRENLKKRLNISREF